MHLQEEMYNMYKNDKVPLLKKLQFAQWKPERYSHHPLVPGDSHGKPNDGPSWKQPAKWRVTHTSQKPLYSPKVNTAHPCVRERSLPAFRSSQIWLHTARYKGNPASVSTHQLLKVSLTFLMASTVPHPQNIPSCQHPRNIADNEDNTFQPHISIYNFLTFIDRYIDQEDHASLPAQLSPVIPLLTLQVRTQTPLLYKGK